METKTIENLATDDFNRLVAGFIDREDDRIEPSTFLKAMAELEQSSAIKEVELTGRLVEGEIIFDTPAPLPVFNNTVYIGDMKMTLRLRT